MLHDFVQQVRQRHSEIVAEWLSAVRADEEIPTARELNEVELRDHLGGVLTGLATRLSEGGPSEHPSAPPEAAKHGVERSRQDYSVQELVREVAVLRSTLLQFFSRYLQSCRQIETDQFLRLTQLIHGYFDEICRKSVAAYVKQRDLEAETNAERLRGVNEALARSNRQYEEADNFRRQTLRTVAHEMATPVNALGLGVSYLSESTEPGEREEAQKLVGRTLEHLRTMLDQLYDFSRSESSFDELKLTRFPVKPLFEYLIAGFEPIAAAKGLDFEATLDPELTTVESDEIKVQRIGINLLSNAIKYCDTGTVALRIAALNDREWQLEVRDTGTGISEGDRERIFQEFERLREHAEQPGLGLGLSIVRSLTNHLGGTISVESELRRGSSFRVTLPRRTLGAETPKLRP